MFGIADDIATRRGPDAAGPSSTPPKPAEGGGREPAPVDRPPSRLSHAQDCRWAEEHADVIACGATLCRAVQTTWGCNANADITSMDFKADGAVLMVGTADLDAFISRRRLDAADRKGRNGVFPTFPWPTVSRASSTVSSTRGWTILCAMRLLPR